MPNLYATKIRLSRLPIQLCKAVFGIKSPYKGRQRLAFIADDLSLADMDAPEVMPAGSTQRVELDPAAKLIDAFYVAETTVRRERTAVSFLA